METKEIEFEKDECERCQSTEGTHVWISKTGKMYFVCMQCYFELPISPYLIKHEV